jgi:hypothetical protein
MGSTHGLGTNYTLTLGQAGSKETHKAQPTCDIRILNADDTQARRGRPCRYVLDREKRVGGGSNRGRRSQRPMLLTKTA